MYLNSASSRAEVSEAHNRNLHNLNVLKSEVSPLVSAAQGLAQTAQEMRSHVSNNGNQGRSIQSRDLIKSIDAAKNTLQSFASKAQRLNGDIDYCSAQYGRVMGGGTLASMPDAYKVRWYTGQIETIAKRTGKLGAEQGAKVSDAVDKLRYAGQYANRSVNSDLGQRVAALNRGLH